MSMKTRGGLNVPSKSDHRILINPISVTLPMLLKMSAY